MTAKISIFERLRRSFLGGAPVGLQSDMQPPAIRREASGATRVQPAEAVALTASAEPAAEWPIADALPAPDETPERHPTDAVDPSGTDHIVAAAAEAEPEPEPLQPEATPATFIEAARKALQDDDAPAAIVLLRDAAVLFPQVAPVHHELARAAERVSDWPLAERAWRDFLQLVTTEGAAYAGLAAALRAQGRANEAEAVLGDGILAVPGDAPDGAVVAIDHARMAEQRGDWTAAAERWAAVGALRPDLPDGPFGHAVALQRMGAGAAAEAVLAALIERFPDHGAALHDLGRLAERRQDWAAAERWWRAFNATHQDFWWSYSALVNAVLRQGRAEEAEALLHEARSRFPDDPNLLADYARQAEIRDDWPEAIRRWEEVIARFPAAWAGYGGKVSALSRMGRQDEADQALLEYGALLPDDPNALHDLGRRAERYQDWQAAEAAWRGFLRQEQRMDWGWLGLVNALMRQDRRAAAADVLAEAMARVPGSVALNIEAARLSEARGQHAEAVAHWRDVAHLSPASPTGPIGEASALSRQGDAAGADSVIEAAIARLPDQPALYEAHAENAVMRGDWQTALARLQAGRQRFPAAPGFAARINDIEERLAAESDIDPAPDAETDQIRALLLAFQSLGGGGGHGGEFAAFQREHGVDPLGLLQWADVLPDELSQALEAEFAGMGEPDQSDVFIPADTTPAEYWITDRHYGVTMPSFIRAYEQPPDEARHVIEKRIRFLRGKLIDDLRAGSQIFVYLHSKRTVTVPELDRLYSALRRYRAVTLLYIRPEDPIHPTGTVVWDRPGLMIGYIDHFSHAADTDAYLGASSASLLVLCGRAHALWLERQGGASRLDRASVPAGD